MIIRAFNLTVGVLVALTVWCYAVMFMYLVVRAALLFYHMLPS
jgi:hypothetical protein